MIIRNPRTNFYDFKHVTVEDMQLEQSAAGKSVALTNSTFGGSGVLLEAPEEVIIFDSENLTDAQSGFVAVNTFDGRGILAAPVPMSDLDEGNQVSVTVEDAKLDGVLTMTVTILGKLFDNSLTYEHLEFENNGVRCTKNHFIEVTNILFQNFQGNNNITLDGYGCYAAGGTVVVAEASSCKVSLDLIANEQVSEPDIIFRDFKVYDSGKTLQQVLQEAIGSSNNVDDLDVNTTTAATRLFEEGDSTELIYGQKFQINSNNVQKISLLLALSSGSTWTGALTVGLRRLATTTSCPSEFLPENEIDFDPESVAIEEITFNQADLAARGYVLNSESQVVDFVFTGSQISNPNLSGLSIGDYVVVTIRRTGSTTTGTIVLEEARNTDTNSFLTVFQSSRWTDVPDSSIWFRVWSDSVKVSSGAALDEAGYYLPVLKIKPGDDGVNAQHIVEDIDFVDTGESTDNYLIVTKDILYSQVEAHPRTGDEIFALQEDVPKFTMLEKDELLTLMISHPGTLPLGKIKDNNARSNPVAITGRIKYPGLCLDNEINIIDPPSDLLAQNVIGSTIIPNTAKPTISYRIVAQEVVTHVYGDVDGDGDIDVFDAQRLLALDGYHSYLTAGSYSSAEQVQAVKNKDVSILEILRADLDFSDGYVIGALDLAAYDDFVDNGTAFPNGMSSRTVVKLTVEPILDPISKLNTDADSTLQVEQEDPDLIDPSNFGSGPTDGIDFQINFIAVWWPEQVEVLDLRRYSAKSFLNFSADNINASPATGGQNDFFVAGDMYLLGSVKNLDGSHHKLDLEQTVIELELPSGTTEGEMNIFDNFVLERMRFSDGSLVSSSALNNDQVLFEVSISSHVKNVGAYPDGYNEVDYDGYLGDGYGSPADEAIGVYIDRETGLMRIKAYNIVKNEFFPELRTKISVSVSLKKSGFRNEAVIVDSDTLVALLT